MASYDVPKPQPTHYVPHGAFGGPQNPPGDYCFHHPGNAPSIRVFEAADPVLPSTPFLSPHSSFPPSLPPKDVYYGEPLRRGPTTKRPFHRRPCVWICSGVVLSLIILVVVLRGTRAKQEADSNANHASNAGGAGQGGGPSRQSSGHPQTAAVTGGDGSTITKEDGTTFTYHNPFGGYCKSTPAPLSLWRSV